MSNVELILAVEDYAKQHGVDFEIALKMLGMTYEDGVHLVWSDNMNNQSYFTASSIQTMQGFLGQLRVKVDYSKHKEANVLILLGTGVYLLSSVNAPQRSCKTYLSDKDTTMQVDVVYIL